MKDTTQFGRIITNTNFLNILFGIFSVTLWCPIYIPSLSPYSIELKTSGENLYCNCASRSVFLEDYC